MIQALRTCSQKALCPSAGRMRLMRLCKTVLGKSRVSGSLALTLAAAFAQAEAKVVSTGAAELLLPQKTLLDVQTNAVCGRTVGVYFFPGELYGARKTVAAGSRLDVRKAGGRDLVAGAAFLEREGEDPLIECVEKRRTFRICS